MRSFTLVLLGVAALCNAAPQFRIGDGSTILLLGGGTPPASPGSPILLPPIKIPVIKPGKREFAALQPKSVEAGFPATILQERAAEVDALRETYLALLEPFTNGTKPSFATSMVLLHLADILAGKGVRVDTTAALGDATTTFAPSATGRQIFEVGSCRDSDVIGLGATLTSLLLIYGNTPPLEIWDVEQAISATLRSCHEDIIVGPIVPDKPIPGGPLVPDKPVPGGPIVTQSPVPGGPIKPSD
ncbi:hypothetical protein CH35J_009164 [Colletotrichum higginsianum]|uniref:Uncharacterized protein n=1 Tax=Colletotrichum higginsianum TaxID=80884 RepID=A0A4T0VMF4_9PEZI|nr:hypothetical protein CH35J_009164 [Colletotrichum higginsianum]